MAASGTLGLSTKCSQVVPMLVSKPELDRPVVLRKRALRRNRRQWSIDCQELEGLRTQESSSRTHITHGLWSTWKFINVAQTPRRMDSGAVSSDHLTSCPQKLPVLLAQGPMMWRPNTGPLAVDW